MDSLERHPLIHFTAGEFTLNENADEILDFVEASDWLASFNLNGSVFNKKIGQLLTKGKVADINFSLDCGTPETFYRIKGVEDSFGKVAGKIEKYSNCCNPRGKYISLKYIISEELGNDNVNDIDGFMEISRNLHVDRICISGDAKSINRQLSETESKALKRLIGCCVENKQTVIPLYERFNEIDIIRINALLNNQ
jgi:MoaA/NifB/PqqE/SkfB family radical SAM enzyme